MSNFRYIYYFMHILYIYYIKDYICVCIRVCVCVCVCVSISISGEGNGNPLQYSCLENTMNRETCTE